MTIYISFAEEIFSVVIFFLVISTEKYWPHITNYLVPKLNLPPIPKTRDFKIFLRKKKTKTFQSKVFSCCS